MLSEKHCTSNKNDTWNKTIEFLNPSILYLISRYSCSIKSKEQVEKLQKCRRWRHSLLTRYKRLYGQTHIQKSTIESCPWYIHCHFTNGPA